MRTEQTMKMEHTGLSGRGIVTFSKRVSRGDGGADTYCGPLKPHADSVLVDDKKGSAPPT